VFCDVISRVYSAPRLHNYIRQLTDSPPPLTRGQKTILAVLCVIVAISRWYALSTSQLDWDESLFIGGLRSYNVIAQHPHPPGYPLFILSAKIAHLVIGDEFRSLQAIVAISSFLLFPATFFFLRELRLEFRVAISGSILTAFLPTVWYYGGTALSDLPALCATIIASALFLAGARNPRAWIAGALVAGIAGGIRPLHVVIAAVPAIVGATAMRRPRTVVAGCAIFAAVIAASYMGAAIATPNPPWGYLGQIVKTSHHIETVDSYNFEGRPPRRQLASTFFVYSHRAGRAGIALIVLAVIGLVNRRMLVILAMFLPIAIVSWLMFDTTAVTRYGLAYVMLYSIGAACGIDFMVRKNSALTAVIVAILTVMLIVWTRPALEVVRHHASPPVVAMRWVQANVPPVGPRLFLDDSLGYHFYNLAGYDMKFFHTYDEIPADAYVAGNYCLVDRRTIQPHVHYFSFPRGRLDQIARDTYFEVSVIPMAAMIRFGDGWYQDEYDQPRTMAWRWMRGSSVAFFPPIGSDGVLKLKFYLPLDALPRPPALQISWNGKVIDKIICTESTYERRYVLPSRMDGANECRIFINEVAHGSGDPRELGLKLLAVSWERADGLAYGL